MNTPLTQEEKLIKIAEACGWSEIENRNTIDPSGGSIYGYPPKNAVIGKKEHLPRFFNDLNAMHSAEKTLTWDKKRKYVGELTCLFGAGSFTDSHCATADQRAETFGKILKLW